METAGQLSPGVEEELTDWQATYDRHHHWERGWMTGEAESDHHHRGINLVKRLEHELGPEWVIDLYEAPQCP